MTKIDRSDKKYIVFVLLSLYLIIFIVMNFKKLVLDFYRVLRNLPNYGKVLALASVATLYVAIHPTVTEPKAIHRHYNRVIEKNGKLDFMLPPMFITKFPKNSEYINTGTKPHLDDQFVVLKTDEKDGSHKYYIYRHVFGHNLNEWQASIMEYRKQEKRRKMTTSFLFSISLCLASYPGLIRRMLNLIPKK